MEKDNQEEKQMKIIQLVGRKPQLQTNQKKLKGRTWNKEGSDNLEMNGSINQSLFDDVKITLKNLQSNSNKKELFIEEKDSQGDQDEDSSNLSQYSDEKLQKQLAQEKIKKELEDKRIRTSKPYENRYQKQSDTFIAKDSHKRNHTLQSRNQFLDTAYSTKTLTTEGGNLPIFQRVRTASTMFGRNKHSQVFKSMNQKLLDISNKLVDFQFAEEDKDIQNKTIDDKSNYQQRPKTVQSNYGRIREKKLQPTLSIYQLGDSKSIAEKSFITGLPLNTTMSPNQKCLENIQNLSEGQRQILHNCLVVSPAKIVPYEDFNEVYYSCFGKNYVHDDFPAPVQVYQKTETQNPLEFRIEKMRNIGGRNALGQPLTNQERKDLEFYKNNKKALNKMKTIVQSLQDRDTKGNIKKIQEELEKLNKGNKQFQKSICMYKIKQHMDELEQKQKEEKKAQDVFRKSLSMGKSPKALDASQKLSLGDSNTQHSGNRYTREIAQKEEGKLRFKLLTNFVNAYKDKMFLTNTVGDQENLLSKDVLNDIDTNDISLDFELFQKIYNFESRKKSNIKDGLVPQNTNTEFYRSPVKDGLKQLKDVNPYDKKYKREKILYYKPNLNREDSKDVKNIARKRPSSSITRGIAAQKMRLMKQTDEIRNRMAQTSSFIHEENMKRKKDADEKEITKHVQEIKDKVFGRKSNTSYSRQRMQMQYNSDGFGAMNDDLRSSHDNKLNQSHTQIIQKRELQNEDSEKTIERVNINKSKTQVQKGGLQNRSGKYRQHNQSMCKIIIDFIDIIENAQKLANLYGSCISEMNNNLSMKDTLQSVSKIYSSQVKQVNEQLSTISKDIKGEQIKFRKFDNYLKK